MRPGSALPRVANYPSYSRTAAGEVIDLMVQLRRPLDPWQQWILRRGLGQNVNEFTDELEMAADQCGCWVPRQNGKGDIIMALELSWLFIFKIPLIIHSAHLYPTAAEAFLRIQQVIEANPQILGKYLKAVARSKGEQGIETTLGTRLRFMARQGGTGLGFSAPRLVLDEAQALTEDLMQTIQPVMSAQPDPQVWFFGTPPREPTAWIYNLKEAGERADDGLAWFDYGIETMDMQDRANQRILRDPATWVATNPSLNLIRGNGTGLRERAIRGELRTLRAGQAFAMDRCGMWLPRAREDGDAAIDPEIWAERAAEVERKVSDFENIAVAWHVNLRRSHSTVGFAAMLPNGFWHVGLLKHAPGTAWLKDYLNKVKEKYRPVAFVVDAKSENTISELNEDTPQTPIEYLGIKGIRLPIDPDEPKRGDLILPTATDVADAFGMLVDAANNGNLEHEDQSPMNSAVSVPVRPLAGGGTLDHKHGIEVGPGIVPMLAMWAYRERIDKVNDYDPLSFIH